MAYPDEVLADSPLCFLKLDELSGTVAADASGNGNAGAYVGAPTLGATALASGTAVTLASASSQEITVATPQLSTTGSIEVWFKYTAGTTLIRDNTAAGGWVIGFDNSGTFTVRVAGTNLSTGRSTASMQDGRRHHLVVTKNAGTVKVYLDGVPVATSAGFANTSSTGTWHIGRNGTASSYIDGTVDAFALYSTEVSAARVLAHFNAPTDKPFGSMSKAEWTAAGQTTGTSLACNTPLANVGDVLLAIVSNRTYCNPTPPAGWVTADSDPGSGSLVRLYSRVVDGTEAASYTWTNLASDRQRITIGRLVNVDLTTPFENVTRPANVASGTTIDLPSLTPTEAGCLYLGVASSSSTSAISFTEVGTITEIVDGGAGSQASIAAGQELQSGTSATGTRTFTSSTTTALWGEALLVRPVPTTVVPLDAASATASSTLGITAPTGVPLAASSGVASPTAALSAPTRVPLDPTSGAGTDSLTLATPVGVPLDPASGQSSATADVLFPAPTDVPLDPASGQSVATADVQVPTATNVPLGPSGGAVSGTLGVSAPTRIPLNPSSGVSFATFAGYTPLLIFPEGIESSAEMGIPSFGAPPPVPREEAGVEVVGALVVARRSFLEAQRRLPRIPVRRVLLATRVGWFADDAETGAVAIVREDGPLAPYVNSTIHVTYGSRELYAYVLRANGTDQDLMISRRAFLALSFPSDRVIPATVEVVG